MKPLSQPRRQLFELLHDIYYGTIENLVIRNGEPVLDPRPKVIRKIKLGGDNGPKPFVPSAAYLSKPAVADLLGFLDGYGDGRVLSIEVQRGLPFQMLVEEVAAN